MSSSEFMSSQKPNSKVMRNLFMAKLISTPLPCQNREERIESNERF